jgi:predicted Zn-dependent protease with MMP-like domain
VWAARAGDAAAAERELAEARRLDAEAFPAEVKVSREEFAQLTARAVAALPDDMRRDLKDVPVSAEDLPALEDLIASDPPLSPSIVGLFRGPPLTEPCTAEDTKSGPCRAVVLYRKNMARSVKDRAELDHQVDVTLHHEIGHLRGEDDTQLVARGLE